MYRPSRVNWCPLRSSSCTTYARSRRSQDWRGTRRTIDQGSRTTSWTFGHRGRSEWWRRVPDGASLNHPKRAASCGRGTRRATRDIKSLQTAAILVHHLASPRHAAPRKALGKKLGQGEIAKLFKGSGKACRAKGNGSMSGIPTKRLGCSSGGPPSRATLD